MMYSLVVLTVVSLAAATAFEGACTNEQDYHAITGEPVFFDKTLSACATAAFGAPAATRDCLKKDMDKQYGNFSLACAQCFGDVTGCGASKCFFECLTDSDSPACRACIAKNCEPALVTCSGLTPDEIPRKRSSAAYPFVLSAGDYLDLSDDGHKYFVWNTLHAASEC